MSFTPTITRYWQTPFAHGEVLPGEGRFSLTINADLGEDRRVTVLTTSDGTVRAAVTPALAERAGLATGTFSASSFRARLAETGITVHDPDNLFYFPESEHAALQREAAADGVRRLTASDGAAFAAFEAAAPEADRDDAFVELDHWAVVGAFAAGRLVSAASAYPWRDAPVADIGVLTVPDSRGRGHARAVVRALSAYALGEGYEPQYRCQLDNVASAATARRAGLTLFGTWEVVSPDSA
ncbi:GCN5-related protein N-acetyltransferase [Beutenbergia cavernae DSM 12333]|uniref:GCN5-related protein N-acetyltransferase n=1 Tax=Beutenbergia cavernae (strain ATCC BAA-8 / DSM 12333 / CCUG 43141 / JCM 11478 / NBRC 16432 / NCIMB 13614 / HKI 0122) TaxID=471853 RepID=C5BYF7_BEUC1|nr:GNAT family N-acetyltransferase [Beutenbergia cavernae]ACQ81057.1 GCN5-related protein N-acetyltransferase [Beutenbergia cavernae DSM 12333]